MAHFTKQLLQATPECQESDLKLFNTSSKCLISQRRTAWRALSAHLLKENNPLNKPIVSQYKDAIEKEIRHICGDVIQIVTDALGRKSERGPPEKDKDRERQEIRIRIEFLKIKGDYLRYLCEIGKDSEYLCWYVEWKRLNKTAKRHTRLHWNLWKTLLSKTVSKLMP